MSPLHLDQWPTDSHFFQFRQAMNVSTDYSRVRRWTYYHLGVTLAMTMSALLATGVQAQSNSCHMLKAVLAKRIDPSVRGYSMKASDTAPSQGGVLGELCQVVISTLSVLDQPG